MVHTLGVRSLRPKLSKVLIGISEHMDRYIITQRGKPTAILLGIDDFEGLLETAEIERDKDLIRRVRKAEKEMRQGKGRSLEEIDRELKLV